MNVLISRRGQPGPAGLPALPEPPPAAFYRAGVIPHQTDTADTQVPASTAAAEERIGGQFGRAAGVANLTLKIFVLWY